MTASGGGTDARRVSGQSGGAEFLYGLLHFAGIRAVQRPSIDRHTAGRRGRSGRCLCGVVRCGSGVRGTAVPADRCRRYVRDGIWNPAVGRVDTKHADCAIDLVCVWRRSQRPECAVRSEFLSQRSVSCASFMDGLSGISGPVVWHQCSGFSTADSGGRAANRAGDDPRGRPDGMCAAAVRQWESAHGPAYGTAGTHPDKAVGTAIVSRGGSVRRAGTHSI